MAKTRDQRARMLADVISDGKPDARHLKPVDIKRVIARKRKKSSAFKAAYDDARQATLIARQLYELRERRGMTQRQVAKLSGTSQQVISRLENPDYAGHSLTMLRRVVAALGGEMHVRIHA